MSTKNFNLPDSLIEAVKKIQEIENLAEGRFIGGTFKTGEGARKRAAFENAHSNFNHRVVMFHGDKPHTGPLNKDDFKEYTWKIERYSKKGIKEEVELNESEMMSFDINKYTQLKKAHKAASDMGAKQFKFDGKDFDTGYAKYMLQYLSSKFEKPKFKVEEVNNCLQEMKAIVTRKNKDGSYDEVGMNNRTIISHLKSKAGIRRSAKDFAKGPHRIEWYSDNIHTNPWKVEHINEEEINESNATDGKYHNSEPGTFNHECGKPAQWIGTNKNGFKSGFCDDCKKHGWERHDFSDWKRIVKEEELSEARRSCPLKGHEYHTKSDEELRYIMKDAHAAAQAMKSHNPKAESKYLDQLNDASTILGYRRRGGKRVLPDKVEENLEEKYLGFKKLEGKLAHKGVSNPGAVAAAIGRKKYGKAKFDHAAEHGEKMKGMKPVKEEEELNELSKRTLSSYADKADKDMDKLDRAKEKVSGKGYRSKQNAAEKVEHKYFNRLEGREKAKEKINECYATRLRKKMKELKEKDTDK